MDPAGRLDEAAFLSRMFDLRALPTTDYRTREFPDMSADVAQHRDSFLQNALTIEEVRAAYLITGRYDFVVHVAVRDMIHLKNLALDKFTSRPR
jgi:DNA-binding Lrp family transcriptional regulator